MTRRMDRIAALIQVELGEQILRSLKDPRLGFVTVTEVAVTPDLKEAKVYYSVLGGEKEKRGTQEALEHSAGFLQHQLADSLKLRFTPKLRFLLDESAARGQEIEKILREIRKGQTA